MVTFLESGDSQNAIHNLTGYLNIETLLDLARRFSETYKSLAKNSTEHFLVTPVTALPTGEEHGKFLAIDVGGSNLRVGFVELLGELTTVNKHESNNDIPAKIKRSHDKSWPIKAHLKMDKPEDLFRWIGDCMAEVVREAIKDTTIAKDQEILLGVTFSFPMAQTSSSEATLLPMGKGFAITTDMNLGEMLLAGYSRHCKSSIIGYHSEDDPSSAHDNDVLPGIRVAAITNDTVATFVSLAYAVKAKPGSRVAMGLIVGTGTNATIPMRSNNLHPSKLNDSQRPEVVDTIVINTEWTIRGTDEPLEVLGTKTSWDRILDQNSDAPGFQPFEYMTSGRYLGEIARLAFVDMVSNEIDAEKIPYALQHKDAIPTQFLSEVIARSDEDAVRTQLVMKFPSNRSEDDSFWTPARMQLLYDIAQAVQRRSSALIAAACVGLLGCSGDIELREGSVTEPNSHSRAPNALPDVEELVIAYTGSTISQYPHWLEDCQRWIDELVTAAGVHPKKTVVLREALDGGIIGAAVLAGMGDKFS